MAKEIKTPASKEAQIDAELHALSSKSVVQLRKRYFEILGKNPPTAFSFDLFRRAIAHQIQVRHMGGLPPAINRALQRVIKSRQDKPKSQLEIPRRIKAGSELVRVWNDKTYKVVVRDDGFAYAGKTYLSLSEIANLITGTRWNGPRFFGLRAKPAASNDKQQ